MAKTIKFNWKDEDYTLEYTRKTIAEMERGGFIPSDIDNKPMTTLPVLFAGAFLAHHRYKKQSEINEIYDALKDKDKLIGVLADMYNEPIMALVGESEETKGNLEWKES